VGVTADFLWNLRDLVLSSRCAVCALPADQPGRDMCRECRQQWHGPAFQARVHPTVYAARPYDRISQRVILAVKERGHHALEPVIAEAIAFASLPLLEDCSREAVYLVPVPSRRSAIRKRGADVLWSIARQSASLLRAAGVSVEAQRILQHTRSVADQSGLNASQRIENLNGAMDLVSGIDRRALSRGSIIVVDDLLTTGASIGEAVRVLAQVGRVAGGACAASTTLGLN
jgi:predicted amidophosphoribosyltransferase